MVDYAGVGDAVNDGADAARAGNGEGGVDIAYASSCYTACSTAPDNTEYGAASYFPARNASGSLAQACRGLPRSPARPAACCSPRSAIAQLATC